MSDTGKSVSSPTANLKVTGLCIVTYASRGAVALGRRWRR